MKCTRTQHMSIITLAVVHLLKTHPFSDGDGRRSMKVAFKLFT